MTESVVLPFLKVLSAHNNQWEYLTDIKGVKRVDHSGDCDCGTKIALRLHRLDGESSMDFCASKIYLCNGHTGSTIDCIL